MSKRILYITTSLPSITLTFVYREIQKLQNVSYHIETVSMNRPLKNHISKEANNLYRSTFYLDQYTIIIKFLSQLKLFFSKPRLWFKLFKFAFFEKEVQSLKDYLRILYHFIEAGFLYSKYKDSSIDQIHSHFLTGPTSIAMFLSKYLEIPFSFTMHASLIYIDPLMLRTKLIKCKKAITISTYNKEYLLSKYGTEFEKKIKIIHCGIDVNNFCSQKIKKKSPPLILAVGQLTERKGFRYILDACDILRNLNISFHCNIIGDGEKKNLMDKYNALNLHRCVSFLGSQPQDVVKSMLQEASIFVLPSIITTNGMREGIPVALMEAMAMELPVVSTKTVGIPELIENGREGFLVEQKNSEQLATALKKLLEDDNLKNKMGKEGRKKVEKYFNISNIPSLFYDIFN